MTVVGVVVLICVVSAIISLPPGRLQSTLYTVPIPMTVVILDTGIRFGSSQLIGLIFLIAFFYTIAVFERLRVSRTVSVLLAVLAYLAESSAVNAVRQPPLWSVIVVFSAIWAIALAAEGRSSPITAVKELQNRSTPRRLKQIAVAVVSTIGSALLGSSLDGYAATFPYSGVPVAIGITGSVWDFARKFYARSLGLAAFIITFHYTRENTSQWPSLGFAWLAYGAGLTLAGVTYLAAQRIANSRHAPTNDTTRDLNAS